MSSGITFTARAELDLVDHRYLYPGVAPALAGALREALRDVVSGRRNGIEVAPRVLRVPVKRFPYLLYFTREGDQLTVLALRRAGVPWGLA